MCEVYTHSIASNTQQNPLRNTVLRNCVSNVQKLPSILSSTK